MRTYYDFHIHSCLSPCGDNDMTPNNIVNMAVLKGLQAIAITDHNCADNVKPCIDAAIDLPITIIPGMEIETAENIHMISLFANVESAMLVSKIIGEHLPKIQNKPSIFGEQIVMDKNDKIIEFKEQFLITACNLDVYSVCDIVRKNDGVIFPAHIDKNSYSILSNLGSIPTELMFKNVEVKNPSFFKADNDIAKKYNVLSSSDAHYLGDIAEKTNFIEVENDILAILNSLK